MTRAPTDSINDTPIQVRNDLVGHLPREMIDHGAKFFTMGECRIIITHDRPEGWHLSISCEARDPTWSEIASARYRLLKNVREMVMHLPPLHEYVNIHKHTFHLYEFTQGETK